MGKKLAKNVHVGGEVYRAGREVPDEVAEKITNPKAWADDDGGDDDGKSDDDGEKKPAARRPAAKKD